MTRAITVFGLLLVCTVAGAISQGPGGRLYMTERYEDEFGDLYVSLKSYQLDANWDIVGADAPMDHGLILDNSNGMSGYKDNAGISPEIEVSGGDGVGANIVMGANYNNDPYSGYAVQDPITLEWTFPYEVMDIVRITTSTDNHSVELLGTGRVGLQTGWYNPNNHFPNTDRGYMALIDPGGTFLDAGQYYVYGADYHRSFSIVTDTNSDGDATDNDEDYLAFTRNSVGYYEDHEFVQGKLWVANSWNGPGAGMPGDASPEALAADSDGIWYREVQQDGSIGDFNRFVWGDPARTDIGLNGILPYGYAMAADVIDGHDAVYVVCQPQSWTEEGQQSITDFFKPGTAKFLNDGL